MAIRTIEVFTAGCPCCDEAVTAIRAELCSNCDLQIRDMRDPKVATDAKKYGIHRVPAVVINGKLADCCSAGAIDLDVLRSMGLGQG